MFHVFAITLASGAVAWAEHSKSLGLASWGSYNAPCSYCVLQLPEVHSLYEGLSGENGPGWPLRGHNDYFEGVALCQIVVPVSSDAELKELDGVLQWTLKQKAGSIGGRVVVTETILKSGITLTPGDRLEPSDELMDIGALSRCKVPICIKLWRAHRDERGRVSDSMHHACPLFSGSLGTHPSRSLCIDALHALYFGPVMRYVTASLWRCILYNSWAFPGPLENTIALGAKHVSAELTWWQQHEQIPNSNRIGSITQNMLGARKGCTTAVKVMFSFYHASLVEFVFLYFVFVFFSYCVTSAAFVSPPPQSGTSDTMIVCICAAFGRHPPV